MIYYVLLFFSHFIQASLVLPPNTMYTWSNKNVGYPIEQDYKKRSLKFDLQNNGGHCCNYKRNNELDLALVTNTSFTGTDGQDVIDRVLTQKGYDKRNFEHCTLSPAQSFKPSGIKHRSFPEDFLGTLLLKFPFCQTSQCLFVVGDYAGKIGDSLYIQLPIAKETYYEVQELYYNDKNKVYYYLDYDNYVRYYDGLLFSDSYNHLYQPIKNIKNAYLFNLITIWKNVGIFLKNYFYDARGHKRLQNSLREAFLTNAGVVFMHMVVVYYLSMLFLFCQSHSSTKLKVAQCVAIAHLGLHIWYSYVHKSQNTTKQN
jgi:hypothetical protein